MCSRVAFWRSRVGAGPREIKGLEEPWMGKWNRISE